MRITAVNNYYNTTNTIHTKKQHQNQVSPAFRAKFLPKGISMGDVAFALVAGAFHPALGFSYIAYRYAKGQSSNNKDN